MIVERKQILAYVSACFTGTLTHSLTDALSLSHTHTHTHSAGGSELWESTFARGEGGREMGGGGRWGGGWRRWV